VRVCECVRACVRAEHQHQRWQQQQHQYAQCTKQQQWCSAVLEGVPPQWRARAGGAAQARAGALRSACFCNALGGQAVLAGLSWLLFSERASSSTPIVPPVFFLSEQTLCE
jgi:hypothetical protein